MEIIFLVCLRVYETKRQLESILILCEIKY